MTDFLRARLDDIRLGMMTLTRLPMGGWPLHAGATLSRAVWTFPIAGALVGALSGGVFLLCIMARLSPLLGAALALVVNVLVTGSFHEDGLADFFDGIGGGRDRARKLEIMRDSRIGTYGAMALILSLLVRWAAIVSLGAPLHVLAVWTAVGALSRAAIAIPLSLLSPARTDGLGAAAAAPPIASVLVAGVIAIASAILLLHGLALLLVVAVLFAALVVTAVARQQLGGFTGDVLGASAVIAEAVGLATASSGWF